MSGCSYLNESRPAPAPEVKSFDFDPVSRDHEPPPKLPPESAHHSHPALCRYRRCPRISSCASRKIFNSASGNTLRPDIAAFHHHAALLSQRALLVPPSRPAPADAHSPATPPRTHLSPECAESPLPSEQHAVRIVWAVAPARSWWHRVSRTSAASLSNAVCVFSRLQRQRAIHCARSPD